MLRAALPRGLPLACLPSRLPSPWPLTRPENVLLKTDPSKAIGFSTKLSDFGLAKILRENYYIVNRCGSGRLAWPGFSLLHVPQFSALFLQITFYP